MNTTSTKLSAWIDGVGLLGPGMESWADTLPVFTGHAPYQAQPVVIPAPQSLPPAERRRAGISVKVALAAAQEAISTAQLDPRQLATVFASSGADGDNCDAICKVLASDDRHISPTRFHNSVHNAPAGYWGIASGAMMPATVVCAYDGSFCAGLLEAMTQVRTTNVGTLLVTYDAPYPEPLNAKRPLPSPFALALVLTPTQSPQSLASIQLDLTDAAPTTLADPALEALRLSLPTARGLPLVQALAMKSPSSLTLDYLAPMHLAISIEPCC